MTNLAEAKLSREAEICYASVSLITDYDCWKTDHAEVSTDMIIAVVKENAINFKKIIKHCADHLPAAHSCACQHALENAIITDKQHISPQARERLKLLIEKYM